MPLQQLSAVLTHHLFSLERLNPLILVILDAISLLQYVSLSGLDLAFLFLRVDLSEVQVGALVELVEFHAFEGFVDVEVKARKIRYQFSSEQLVSLLLLLCLGHPTSLGLDFFGDRDFSVENVAGHLL